MLQQHVRAAPALLPPRLSGAQALRTAPACRRRSRAERGAATRASLVDSAITMAEASVGLAALQLAGRAIGAGGRQAAASTAATALGGVAAAPDAMFGGQKKWVKLGISVALDAFGASSYLLPGLGEATDAGWAPVSAILVQALYGSKLLSALDFIEEALPFSDLLPTACIGWSLEYTPFGALVGWLPKDAKKK